MSEIILGNTITGDKQYISARESFQIIQKDEAKRSKMFFNVLGQYIELGYSVLVVSDSEKTKDFLNSKIDATNELMCGFESEDSDGVKLSDLNDFSYMNEQKEVMNTLSSLSEIALIRTLSKEEISDISIDLISLNKKVIWIVEDLNQFDYNQTQNYPVIGFSDIVDHNCKGMAVFIGD